MRRPGDIKSHPLFASQQDQSSGMAIKEIEGGLPSSTTQDEYIRRRNTLNLIKLLFLY